MHKTAFVCHLGQYQYRRMRFGLTSFVPGKETATRSTWRGEEDSCSVSERILRICWMECYILRIVMLWAEEG